ncbi:MAG TPA: ABC transporter ATP-binding protein [Acidimicrobiales bacterium]|nr:ABC transporter ATP-binding protein [Acidimicrobiales bacterium]
MTSVVVRDLHKSFGDHRVLAGVELDVADGSLTAVLGPSGSGKTTLLRVLAGFERADRGCVEIGGQIVEDGRVHVPPEARRIGYVPQEGALFPHLDAAGNVGFGLPRRERKGKRVEDLLELVGLEGEGRRYPHQLSGGQQQRVALARALATRPSLVLLDEPFSSLDAALRAEMRGDIARVLAEARTTAVLVTHDQDEALSLADRVAVLREGRVAQSAGPEELYSRPVDPAVATFVGDANIFEATVRSGQAQTPLGPLDLGRESSLFGEGDPVLVLVRPEQVVLANANGSQAPYLRGRVSNCQFFGHDMLVTVLVDKGASRVQARLTGGAPWRVGHLVSIKVAGPVRAWPTREGPSSDWAGTFQGPRRAGSGKPSSENPFSRNKQESQVPHGRPSGPGS